ncbi:MAG: DUF502 domain-containing protein [Candidatus Eisenbacteria bacterium]|nr:DUF502 domain-containing protein [Candidatus Eisenbacteria bacterium]
MTTGPETRCAAEGAGSAVAAPVSAPRMRPGRRLRRYFLTGLAVILPAAVSLFVLWRIFSALDRLLGQIFEAVLGFKVPGAGLVALLLLVLGIGAVAHNVAGKRLIRGIEDLVIRVPFVRWIYRTTKELSSAVLEERAAGFRKVVLVEFPYRGVHTIGFQTAEASRDVSGVGGKRMCPVFVPTAPNPMSGYVILYPEDEVISLPMSVDDGLRFVISAGALTARRPPDGGRG